MAKCGRSSNTNHDSLIIMWVLSLADCEVNQINHYSTGVWPKITVDPGVTPKQNVINFWESRDIVRRSGLVPAIACKILTSCMLPKQSSNRSSNFMWKMSICPLYWHRARTQCGARLTVVTQCSIALKNLIEWQCDGLPMTSNGNKFDLLISSRLILS